MEFKRSFIVYGIPIPKPRMSRADVWKKRPIVTEYRAFADRCRTACTGAPDVKLDDPSVIGIDVIFVLPVPESWRGKMRADHFGAVHRVRPDLDNLIKSVFDAVFINDSSLYHIRAAKRYAKEGEEPHAAIELVCV